MWRKAILLTAAALAAVASSGGKYTETGDCEATHEQLYKYVAKEEYFDEEMGQTFQIIVHFKALCETVGTYGEQRAKLYRINVTKAEINGSVINREEEDEGDMGDEAQTPDLTSSLSSPFFFVQTEDGSVPSTYYSREENHEVVNIMKAIVSAFQANFKGTKTKEEADPQSLHKSEYSYEASMQDTTNGVLRMHRKITTDDVESYAHHVPSQEVQLEKDEDIVYERGVLREAKGTIQCTLMQKQSEQEEDDYEEDQLEAEYRRKRGMSEPQDPDLVQSFDPNLETNRYSSKGSYTLELVGQKRLLRKRRSTEGQRDLSSMVENTLLGFINHTRRQMEKMMELRHEMGDIHKALVTLHSNPNNSAIAHKVEHLVKLEARCGPLPNQSPAIDEVLDYLAKLSGSRETKDIEMRILLYFIISPEGSLRSQMALLDSLENAVDDEEKEAVILYIALVDSPQPRFVAKLESVMSSDVHSTDPLLLAYGAIIPKASPELQQRMVLFLTNRLPEAETNTTSLIHHILSLGNSGSPHASNHLIDYLGHPETDIQLIAIFATRFLLNQPSVEKALKEVLIQPDVTEDHLTAMAKSLMYGCEKAIMENEQTPYSKDLVEGLVALSLYVDNDELHSALSSYLKGVDTKDSRDLLQLMRLAKAGEPNDKYGNITRLRRGSRWDDRNSDYNIILPLSQRQTDVRRYQNKLAYIWSKKFGVSKIYAQVAAGGFVGVSNAGDYKLFGRAIAKTRCYNRHTTILDFLILRQKDSRSTLSRLYTVVMGKTLINVRYTQDSSVCMTIPRTITRSRKYTVFDFTYSVFVVVGTLNFRLRATIQFTGGLYTNFCENRGSLTAAAGLSPTLTITVSASGDLEIVWVAKAGLTLDAIFNYKVQPEVSSMICYKGAQVRVKNCIGVYHQWTDNKLELYAWYAWRGWCGWWACTGSKAYRNKKKIKGLSTSWNLPASRRRRIWETCDRDFTC